MLLLSITKTGQTQTGRGGMDGPHRPSTALPCLGTTLRTQNWPTLRLNMNIGATTSTHSGESLTPPSTPCTPTT